MKRTVTGIKPTGTPHVGNYIGAIKPALQLAENPERETMYFMADLHALNAVHDARKLKEMTYEVAATWLALGLNPDTSLFYRQSEVPELVELQWILASVTSKGLMNRAHAYKARVSENMEHDREADDGINMGLYNYPVMMAADILMFQGDEVPVGKDNVQHVEMARDIAGAFNRTYEDTFKLPSHVINEHGAVVPGLDGRKMSKSYDNTIPLFVEEHVLEKLVKRVITDSKGPDEPKDTNNSTLFTLYQEFATNEEIAQMKRSYQEGIGYGKIKEELFRVMNRTLQTPRSVYRELMNDQQKIDQLLHEGAGRARNEAQTMMHTVKKRVGLK